MSANNASAALAYVKSWHHVDATGVVLGRMASAVANVLMGKHKPVFHPAADCGDYVVVTNCAQVKLLGRSWEQPQRGGKVYYSHSKYPGSLQKTSIQWYMQKDPNFVIMHAVKGMLPKNRLRRVRLARLKLFPGPEHPYAHNLLQSYAATINK